MLEYINQLRAAGDTIETAAIEGAVLRLRPIMMTMLVAALGLLPAALSHAIGSDSQRPFAIVIVGGLFGAFLLSAILLPTLYVWVARDGDRLPEPEPEFAENNELQRVLIQQKSTFLILSGLDSPGVPSSVDVQMIACI